MSIWSSFFTLGDTGSPGDDLPAAGRWLDFARSYPGDLLRVSVEDETGTEAEIEITRAQAARLRDALTAELGG